MKKRAVFLDRDGVINCEKGHYYVHKIRDFVLTPHLCEALKLLHNKGFILLVITNQGGIAKGVYSIEDVEILHQCLQTHLAQHGVQIKEMYFCPHNENFGKCLCRKPLPLLIEKAAARFNIDLSQSYFIGDSERDIQAASAAGVSGILVDKDAGIFDIAMGIS